MYSAKEVNPADAKKCVVDVSHQLLVKQSSVRYHKEEKHHWITGVIIKIYKLD